MSPSSALFTAVFLLFTLRLVVIRLALMAPRAAKLGYLPRSWRHWILGKPDAKKT